MHALEGPRLKIRRAKSEIQRLSRTEDSFRSKANYKLIKSELNPKTGNYVYRIRVGREPDLEWGVYIGEIAHNLRSALDGLVYQLVLVTGKTPASTTQFPIFLIGRTIRQRRRGKALVPHFEGMERADGRSMIQRVSMKHQAVIEGLQPYKRIRRHSLEGSGRDNALHLLRELNNADKHRLLQVVGGKPAPSHAAPFGIRTSAKVASLLAAGLPSGLVEVTGPHFVVLTD